MTAGRDDQRWRALSARLRREWPAVCWQDGLPIDLRLNHRHRLSWTLDHIIPLDEIRKQGLDPELIYAESNLRIAHRSCNGRRGAGRAVFPPNNSRAWG